jgi:hypothetical protein
MAGLEGAVGAVTAVTGFEKGSGKTTFLNHALPFLRQSGPVAIFTIGVDGALKARDLSGTPPEITVEPGDVVMTTDTFARLGTASLEVLEALPGRSALGRLFLGRAMRGGSVTLAGSEHFSVLAETIARVRQEHWAHSVLVDGAVNRITQVSALGEVGFVFTVRIDRGNLTRAAQRIRNLSLLAALPHEPISQGESLCIEGPLTHSLLESLPKGTSKLSLEDFTKVFLEPVELSRVLSYFQVSVRRAFPLLCVAVTLRDVSRVEFLSVAGESLVDSILFNPYEVAC